MIEPLTEEVGESLLAYLRHGRPRAPHPEVFLAALQPFKPLRNPSTVTVMVTQRLRRAGVSKSKGGSHVFLHGFATRMLQHGQSIKTIADMLAPPKHQHDLHLYQGRSGNAQASFSGLAGGAILMTTPDFVSVRADRFSNFLSFRRAGGVDCPSQIQLPRHFDGFLGPREISGSVAYPRGGRKLSGDGTTPPASGTRDNRLSLLRQFCRYLRQLEPECFIPERMLLWQRRPSQLPHIVYRDGDRSHATSGAARELPPVGSLRPRRPTLRSSDCSTPRACGVARLSP